MDGPWVGSGRVQEAGDISGWGWVTISVGQVGSQNLDPRATVWDRMPITNSTAVLFVFVPSSITCTHSIRRSAVVGECRFTSFFVVSVCSLFCGASTLCSILYGTQLRTSLRNKTIYLRRVCATVRGGLGRPGQTRIAVSL